jgi:predicted P-loop ATPase
VWCKTIDLGWIRESREQLFAEAMVLCDEGLPWWDVPKDLARAEVEQRRDYDEWEDVIGDYLVGKEWVTLTQVMQFALDLNSIREQTEVARKRAAKAMRQLNWRITSRRLAGVQNPKRVWVHSTALERALCEPAAPTKNPLNTDADLEGF